MIRMHVREKRDADVCGAETERADAFLKGGCRAPDHARAKSMR